MLAASDPALADALLLLSYPLHPPKAPDQLRTAHDLLTPRNRATLPQQVAATFATFTAA
jgi:predicted alpha/beta-hydrolase family hydrolase